MSEWISVKDKLPVLARAVLTQHTDDLYPIVAFMLSDDKGEYWYAESEGDEGSLEHNKQLRSLLRAPTHWQPLPAPPKEGPEDE